MGLRINSNIPSLIGLHHLRTTDARLQQVLTRLSTGLRINRGADDPLGVAISESLRAEIQALRQASTNAQSADNLLTTADAALGELSDLLISMRSSVLFAMDGSSTPDQVDAEQHYIDESLNSISRLAATSRFGRTQLLNGESGFSVTSLDTTGLRRVLPEQIRFNPVVDPTPFSVQVTTPGAQATVAVASGVSGGAVSLRVTGPIGTASVELADGSTAATVLSAIDSVRGFTGIFASGGSLFTEDYGSAAGIRIENASGTGTVNGLAPGQIATVQGVDVVASFLGSSVTGQGNTLHLREPGFTGTIEIQPGAAAAAYDFTVSRSGMQFQVGAQATVAHQPGLGIPDMAPSNLGRSEVTIGGQTIDGFLSSLATGQANDLRNNPGNALRILDVALADIGRVRSSLGSFTADVLQPSGRFNEVAVENLEASQSQIRDADLAAEASELARGQVLLEAGMAVLAQANSVPRAVLQLLQA